MIKLKELNNFPEGEKLSDITGIYDGERLVNHVDFLQKDCVPDPFTLFLCKDAAILNSSEIRLIAQEQEQPLMILTSCRGHFPFPVVQISPAVNLRKMFSEINERLNFEARIQQETNELYHRLYSGRGLDDLVVMAEQFLNRPISILDAGYNMIAVSPRMRKMPFGMETTDDATFLSESEVESLRRLQIEQNIYRQNQAFFSQTEDHPDTNWIFCAIRIQHVMSGYVAVCLENRDVASEYELRLTTVIADICAVEMQKHAFFASQTGFQYETFLTELIEGRFSDVNMVESRLRLLNRRLGKFFCLIILHSTQPHNSDLFNKRQMSTLRKVYPNCMSVVYKDNIVLLVNQDTPVQQNSDFTDPLREFARRNQLKAGLSQPFSDILKIRLFYEQAFHTLELTNLAGTEECLFFSTETLPQYLFSNCDYLGLEIGIHYHIFQLRDYDRTCRTEFVETLRAYLKHDRNASRTAEALHIHRSTFFYRIKKIEELLDINITDSHLLFLYELSFKIWDYLYK